MALFNTFAHMVHRASFRSRGWKERKSRHHCTVRSLVFKPRLEELESRMAPAVLTVNTLADETTADSFLSLREAINVVNSGSTGSLGSAELGQVTGSLGSSDRIVFASSLAGKTITLTMGELAIAKNLDIDASSLTGLNVSGNGASRVFHVTGAAVSMENLTITQGSPQNGNGGGILIAAGSNVTLTNCIVADNAAVNGGGIANTGGSTLTLSGCTIGGATAYISHASNGGNSSVSDGAGVYNSGSTLHASSTLFGDNQLAGPAFGAGIANEAAATLTLTDCQITSNSGSNSGVGLRNDHSTASLTRCWIDSNTAPAAGGGAGGGINSNDGSITLDTCSVTNNLMNGTGGGIYVAGDSSTNPSTLMLTSCDVSGNSTTNTGHVTAQGGGIYAGANTQLTLTSSSVSDNSTPGNGGGLQLSINSAITDTLTSCTVAGNSGGQGGGMYVDIEQTGQLVLSNCTVANNTSTSTGGGGMDLTGSGSITITNCTVAGNSANGNGTGIFDGLDTSQGNGKTTLHNTIVAQNNNTSTFNMVKDLYFSGSAGTGLAAGGEGNNFVGSSNYTGWAASDLIGGSPGLDVSGSPFAANLKDNGGPAIGAPGHTVILQTAGLLLGSPCINVGSNTVAPVTDERGFTRISASDPTVDMGAFEFQPISFAVVNAPTPIIEGGTATLTGTINDSNPQDTVTIEFNWGDNQTSSGTFPGPGPIQFTATHPYAQESANPYAIALSASNAAGTASASTSVTVNDAVPTVAADNSAVSAADNTLGSNTGTFGDLDDSVIITASIGGIAQDNRKGTWSWFGTGDHLHPFNVTITATNADGSTAATSFGVSFYVQPVSCPPPPVVINEFPAVRHIGPYDLTAGPDGNLWFTDQANNAIGEFNPVTHVVNEFTLLTPSGLPKGITVGPDCELWFVDAANNNIGEIDPTTHVISEFPIPTSYSFPEAIAPGPDGNLWFTESEGNQIGEINPTTHTISELALPTLNNGPNGITTGPDGNLWFTESFVNQIAEINPATHVISEFSIPTPSSFPGPITTGPDGNLWFTENNSASPDKIGEINPTTHAISEFAIPTPSRASFTTGPDGITTGPDGNLWFTEYTGSQIGAINPTTHAIREFAIPTASSFPVGITTGPDGNLWFAERGGRQIAEAVLTSAISASSGNDQSVPVGTPFGTLLEAQVTDVYGGPISGATVTFTESNGPSGAGATFPGGMITVSALTNAQGIAIAPMLTGNQTGGGFTVIAQVGTLSTVFDLTNLPPAAITPQIGTTPQAALVTSPYNPRLAVQVSDAAGDPVSGVAVTFTAPLTGPSGTFNTTPTPGTSDTEITDVHGIATAQFFTANTAAGSFVVTARAGALAASFDLTNQGNPASPNLSALAGNNQSAVVHGRFGTLLEVQVTDPFGNPLPGTSLTFTVNTGPSGARAFFAVGGTTISIVTNAQGLAIAPILTANQIAGSFAVTAQVGTLSTTFDLSNLLPPAPATIAPQGSSTPQAALVTTPYNAPLAVQVTDAFGNPVNGVAVTFTAPFAGASGTFAGPGPGTFDTEATNVNGIATAQPFTANTIAGSFIVTARAGALSTSFDLTNQPIPVGAVPHTVLLAGSARLELAAGSSFLPTVSAVAGNNQSTTPGTPFATLLEIQLRDYFGNLLPGASVNFTLASGPTGASAFFIGGAANVAITTNAEGLAIAPVLTASQISGSFTVTAQAGTVSTTFDLAVTPGSAAFITVAGATPQNTPIGSAFPSLFQVLVTDSFGNPLANVPVTFAGPVAGPSGSFNSLPTVLSNALGIATAPLFTANHLIGSYTMTASAIGVASPASIGLTNTAIPAAIRAVNGTHQHATVDTTYGTPLEARVTDAQGHAVAGITVVFELPGSGPSGAFAGPAAVVTDGSGLATAPALTANTTAGTFTVNAWVTGVSTPVVFTLTNEAGLPHMIKAFSGTPQSTQIGFGFLHALQAQVLDQYGNPVSGVQVTFTAPAAGSPAGATGTFQGHRTATATSNAQGLATAPTLSANHVTGGFTVSANISGASAAASFNLTNTLPQAFLTATEVFGRAVTARLPASGVQWYKYTTPFNSSGGTFTFSAEATLISGQGSLGIDLFTPTGIYLRTGALHGHPPFAQVTWSTAASNSVYYFRVKGSPGLTYSIGVIVPPT
jgi:CSLREA domain-containing protein